MMNKTEQNMLDMARQSAQSYKQDFERLNENIQDLKGYLRVYETFEYATPNEIKLCQTILKYLK